MVYGSGIHALVDMHLRPNWSYVSSHLAVQACSYLSDQYVLAQHCLVLQCLMPSTLVDCAHNFLFAYTHIYRLKLTAHHTNFTGSKPTTVTISLVNPSLFFAVRICEKEHRYCFSTASVCTKSFRSFVTYTIRSRSFRRLVRYPHARTRGLVEE